VVGADVVAEGVGEAAGDALELARRMIARVEFDAALAAAEGDVVQGALERHPGGQRLDLVQRHLVVEADAALVGAEHVVVLDAVALEQPVLAVVQAHREVDDQLVLRLRQDLADGRGKTAEVSRLFELELGDLVGIGFRGCRRSCTHLLSGLWKFVARHGRKRRRDEGS
jgi:hypothetical protein